MQTAEVLIQGNSRYSQSKYIDKDAIPKIGKEKDDDYEKRVWKSRVHVDDKNTPYMPPMSLKKSLEGAAPYLGKIQGQGQATYTKRVKSGLLILDPIKLFVNNKPITYDDFVGEWLFLDAQGKNGDKRVKRCMPMIENWSAQAIIYICDEVITETVLEKLITDAGMFVGVGRFRPSQGGFYGRFKLKNLKFV